MRQKRNPIKQIMSDVHRDVRSGKVDLRGHEGFIAEVKKRVLAAGLAEDDVHRLTSGEHRRGTGSDTSGRDSE